MDVEHQIIIPVEVPVRVEQRVLIPQPVPYGVKVPVMVAAQPPIPTATGLAEYIPREDTLEEQEEALESLSLPPLEYA